MTKRLKAYRYETPEGVILWEFMEFTRKRACQYVKETLEANGERFYSTWVKANE